MVGCLPSKSEALGSNSSTKGKKRKEMTRFQPPNFPIILKAGKSQNEQNKDNLCQHQDDRDVKTCDRFFKADMIQFFKRNYEHT
jgi:hypothetical protein